MSAAVSEVEVVKSDALAPALSGLESNSARQLREAFVPALLQIEEWERQATDLTVTDESQTAKMELAGVMRRALKKVRVGVEKKRKELNADALARTRAINGAAGIIEGLIVPLEKRLLEQETFGERAAEARRNNLRDARREAIRAYGTDPDTLADLGLMADETWADVLSGARVAHEAKLEAARQAEAVRIEAERIAAEARAAARKEAIRVEAERVAREQAQAEENARLKREAAEREESARVEREAAVRAQAEAEAQAKAERDTAAEEKRRARAEIERVEAELAAERAAIAKAERERAEAEAARIEEAKAAEADRLAKETADRQAAELAPDREKLQAFAVTLRGLTLPTLTTKRGQAAAAKVADQIEKMASWVEKTGAAL